MQKFSRRRKTHFVVSNRFHKQNLKHMNLTANSMDNFGALVSTKQNDVREREDLFILNSNN